MASRRFDRDWQDAFQEGYAEGFEKGYVLGKGRDPFPNGATVDSPKFNKPTKRRKLSAWQKFVKTNSKMPRFKYKTGKRKGMVNMKALAAAWKRKKKR